MPERIRVMSPEGMAAFGRALADLRQGEVDVDLDSLRTDVVACPPVEPPVTIDVHPFPSRYAAAAYFENTLAPLQARMDIPDGVWAWLSLAWIDELAPLDKVSGSRPVGATARWIPTTGDYKTYYRHLLSGPYRILRAHKDDPGEAMALLATPVSAPGEVVEQVSARRDIVNSRALGVVTRLYYDPEHGRLKRGSGGKEAGSARRLVEVLAQLDLTYDIYAMPTDRLLALLPPEFNRFR